MPSSTAQNLCLHYLDPSGRRRLALTPDALRAVVTSRRDAGQHAVALVQHATPHAFTLSFDDAHRSVLTEAAPLLRALDVPATLFVPTAWVGMSDEFLSWDELRALRDLGWSLGSHTVTHPRMSWRLHGEADRATQARLDEECARSREVMERALGVEVTLFAYPYGEAPEPAREAVRRAGYTTAFTVSDTLAWDGDPLRVPRLDGPPERAPAVGQEPIPLSVVVPACDRVAVLREVVQRLSAQSYPEDRYEVLVVDDGSREDLAPALRDARANVRLIPHAGEPGTFRAGMARQRGADEARFEHLAFLDADVAVDRDFLWHLDWIHQRVPRAVILGYLSGYNLHDLGKTHTLADLAGRDTLDGSLGVIPDRSREPTLRACLDNLDWLDEPWRLAYTGNLSVPRALLREVSGFARDFRGWGLEDLDLGVRLHRAHATWVFARFAVGYHLLDPTEGPSRNPFRRAHPTRDDFAGYLANLDTLRAQHPDHPGVAAFCEQSRHDVDETCGRPYTVGVECGGESVVRSPWHRALHRCAPGGVRVDELLDRVAYAQKVGARQLYVLGGEPAEHPGFLPLLRASRAAGLRTLVETNAIPFAHKGFARTAADAGMDHAVLEVWTFAREGFAAGVTALRDAGVRRSARVMVCDETVGALDETLATLARDEIPIDEAVLIGDVAAATLPAGVRVRRVELGPDPAALPPFPGPSPASGEGWRTSGGDMVHAHNERAV
jgi:glycosyltransferase involved in cell wall biosynthesis